MFISRGDVCRGASGQLKHQEYIRVFYPLFFKCLCIFFIFRFFLCVLRCFFFVFFLSFFVFIRERMFAEVHMVSTQASSVFPSDGALPGSEGLVRP